MPLVVNPIYKSLPMTAQVYNITGLTAGANAIVLPSPPASGSFPPLADWTPTVILCFPYATGGVGAAVTPDYTTIVNTAGAVTFTLYSSGNSSVLVFVY